MITNTRAFKKEDFSLLVPQEMQIAEYERYQHKGEDFLLWIENENNAITILRDETVLAIAGMLPCDDGGGSVWFLLSEVCKTPEMIVITRILETAFKTLRRLKIAYVMTAVLTNYERGKRWVRMFGFKETNVVADYMHNGTSYTIWKKVLV